MPRLLSILRLSILSLSGMPLAFALPAIAEERAPAATVEMLSLPPLPLGRVEIPSGKTLTLNVGFGSGLFRAPSDPEGVIWAITDRGPNVDCKKPKDITGLGTGEICGGDKDGKIFPLPAFTPTIYKLKIDPAGAVSVLETLPLKGQSGKPTTGLPNDLKSTEAAFSVAGKPIGKDPSGLDTEALVRLPDGSFWISEEYAPSLVEVAPDGTIRRRLVPEGLADRLTGADYEIAPVLPAILARRALNHGIESLAVSPDGAFLYALMQGALANPGKKAADSSPLARLIKLDRKTGAVVGSYAYRASAPGDFKADAGEKTLKQSDVKMSEMVAVGQDRLLVLERIDKTTKLFLVDLAGAAMLPRSIDAATTPPTLEQLAPDDFARNGVTPLAKTLILDSDRLKDLPAKIEGVAVLSDRELVLVSDSDFGIKNDTTQMRRVRFDKPVLK
ncbi:esterase-like activity of phytase family protein [Xanthobacter sp. VTT E-85241]|uniref:esterase-like activity of phytase family protein n=1 Tax=Roseixanthobacter finlandensis TaxID=3119922 RepID=UPI0037288D7F